MTESVANIVEKWDFSHQKYKDCHQEKAPKGVVKNECVCFERFPVAEDSKMGKFFQNP